MEGEEFVRGKLPTKDIAQTCGITRNGSERDRNSVTGISKGKNQAYILSKYYFP